MKAIQVIISFSIVVTFCSCLGDRSNNAQKGTEEYTMQLVDDKLFSLDSMTSQEVNYMQLIGDTSLAVFNAPMNNICFFDWATGKKRIKVNLHKEGSDVVKGISGFYFQSKDSIRLYNDWREPIFSGFRREYKGKKRFERYYSIAKQSVGT